MYYVYKIAEVNGRIKRGMIRGEDKEAAVSNLAAQGRTPIYLQRIGWAGLKKPDFWFAGSIPVQEMMVITRQLSAMLGAGLNILPSLDAAEKQVQNLVMKETLFTVKQDLLNGLSMAQSLEKHPKAFSSVYTNMIRAGESSGLLPKTMEQLSLYLEKELEIKQKIRAAALYPCIIFVLSVIMVLFLILFIMPSFVSMYQSSGVIIPLPTRILLSIGNIVGDYWGLIIIKTMVLSYIIWRVYQKPVVRLHITKALHALPYIGKVVSGLSVARFSRTMGSLAQAGVPVIKGLEITEGIVGNPVISNALKEARQQISTGTSIAEPLRKAKVFNPMVIQMIAAGEETGSLDHMLVKLADYYEKEVFYLVNTLISILEPLLILLVAIMVGFIVIAVIMPIMSMMDILQI